MFKDWLDRWLPTRPATLTGQGADAKFSAKQRSHIQAREKLIQLTGDFKKGYDTVLKCAWAGLLGAQPPEHLQFSFG